MEDVLAVYARPYDPAPAGGVHGREALPAARPRPRPDPRRPGHDRKEDSEYVRHGTCSIFVWVEPLARLAPRRRPAAPDQDRLGPPGRAPAHPSTTPTPRRVVLVMDNLNTHTIGSLYEAFEPGQGLRPGPTPGDPPHPQTRLLAQHRRDRTLRPDPAMPRPAHRPTSTSSTPNSPPGRHATNADQRQVDWQFTTADARIKLRHLYPALTQIQQRQSTRFLLVAPMMELLCAARLWIRPGGLGSLGSGRSACRSPSCRGPRLRWR